MFLLVLFTDHNELAVIPENWLEGTSCAVWPPYLTDARIIQAVRNREPPLDSWKAYPIEVIYTHEIYENARAKLSKAERDSDIQTDLDTGETKEIGRGARRKRSPNRYDGAEADEDDTLPAPHRCKSKRTGASRKGGQTSTASESTTPPISLPTPPVRLTYPATHPVLTSPTTPAQLTAQATNPVLTSPTTPVQLTAQATNPVRTSATTPVQLTYPATHPVLTSATTPVQLTAQAIHPVRTSPTTPVQLTAQATHPVLTSPTTPVQLTAQATNPVRTSATTPVQLAAQATHPVLTLPATPVLLTSQATHPVLTLPATPVQLTAQATHPVLTSATTPVQLTAQTIHPVRTSATTPFQLGLTAQATRSVITSPATPVQLTAQATRPAITSPATPVQLISPSIHPAITSPAKPVQLTRVSTITSPASSTGLITAKDIRLFTILEQIREEQRHHTAVLSTIVTKLGDGLLDDEMPNDISFPIKNLAEMTAFEEKLQDVGVQKLIVSHLTAIGGSSIENMGSRILKHAMSNKLAESYNWTGSKNKSSFGRLMLPSLIKRAIRRSFREVTEARVTEICRIFFEVS